MDAISVPDNFTVGSVSVSEINVAHTHVGALQVTLLHKATPATNNSAVTLKPSRVGATGQNLANTAFADSATVSFPAGGEEAPFTNTYKPAQPLSSFTGQPSIGTWVLRVADVGKNPAERPITLTSWSLQICPAAAVGASGGTQDKSQGASGPSVNVSLSQDTGLQVSVGPPGTSNITNATSTNNGTFKMSLSRGGLDIESYSGAAEDMMRLIFPFSSPANSTPAQFGPAVSAMLNGKSAVRSVFTNQLADAAMFVQRQSAVIKDTINTKIARLINSVNAGSTATQGILKTSGSQIQNQAQRIHGSLLTLRGQIAAAQNLKAAAKADIQNVIEHCLALLASFTKTHTAVAGDMGSSLMMLRDATAVKAKAVMDTYQTAEGVAKMHVDNVIVGHVGMLNALLDKIIGALDATAKLGLTGPLIDAKINLDKAALSRLSNALDIVAKAVRAIPAPSKALQAKMDALRGMLGATRVGSMMTDPEKAMADMMNRITQAQQLIKAKTQAMAMAG
eukprot:gene8916-9093_t